MTENYVASDIKYLIDQASRQALKTKSRITMEIFETVLAETKPSISAEELKKYENMDSDTHSEPKHKPKKGKIGFV